MTLEERYTLASIRPHYLGTVQKVAEKLCAFNVAYRLVEKVSRVPWWCIGTLHSLESSFNFRCHLHNGDPLSSRTVRVPRGRPVAPPQSGELPYSWVESASDALSTPWRPESWTRATALTFLERYNGLGYREMGVPSPYLWACTDQYTSGLFVADGKYDPLRVSQNVGGAAIFKALEARGILLSAAF